MEDHTFDRIVAEEVKGKASDLQRAYLLRSENRDRWIDALRRLIDNLEGQLRRIDAEHADTEARHATLGTAGVPLLMEAIGALEVRRARAARFLHFVETRLDEVVALDLGADPSDPRDVELALLRRAIEAHRDGIAADVADPDLLDEALWAALDGKWRFPAVSARPSAAA